MKNIQQFDTFALDEAGSYRYSGEEQWKERISPVLKIKKSKTLQYFKIKF